MNVLPSCGLWFAVGGKGREKPEDQKCKKELNVKFKGFLHHTSLQYKTGMNWIVALLVG